MAIRDHLLSYGAGVIGAGTVLGVVGTLFSALTVGPAVTSVIGPFIGLIVGLGAGVGVGVGVFALGLRLIRAATNAADDPKLISFIAGMFTGLAAAGATADALLLAETTPAANAPTHVASLEHTGLSTAAAFDRAAADGQRIELTIMNGPDAPKVPGYTERQVVRNDPATPR